ncbi:hypothetical protein ACWDRY_33200, partial [Streptomyces cellulosae]
EVEEDVTEVCLEEAAQLSLNLTGGVYVYQPPPEPPDFADEPESEPHAASSRDPVRSRTEQRAGRDTCTVAAS